MYGETRTYDYQIVEADQYRGVQVWGLYHVGADFSIVENTSEHWGRGKTVVSDQWGGRGGENEKTGRVEAREDGRVEGVGGEGTGRGCMGWLGEGIV